MSFANTYLPRPVVVYYFFAPCQRLVRWSYPTLRAAKKEWSVAKLKIAAGTLLQPWLRQTHWAVNKTGDYEAIYTSLPSKHCIVRYQSGEPVPSSLIDTATYKSRRRKSIREEIPSQRAVGRRLRFAQILEHAEPAERSKLRVHRYYYEDAWSVRASSKNWKQHRPHQWRSA